MKPTIRKATIGDAAKIAQFQINMAQETESKQLDATLVLAAVEKVFRDSAKGFYVVAESENGAFGSLMITFEWSDWRDTNMWYIQSVYIEKKFRGQKIFSRMFEFVKQLAQTENVKVIRLYVETDNHHAQKVYESLGMKKMPYHMYDISVPSDGDD